MAEGSNIKDTIKRYRDRLFGFIRTRVSSSEDAEDILQEVWYRLSRLIDLDDLENISGWLFQVARNQIIDRYRKSTDELYEDMLFEDQQGAEFKDILLGASLTPEDELFKEIFWQELNNALQELPAAQREAFELHELEGYSLKEIAARNNENIKTIISRKQYAVKHLRKRLKELYDDL